MEYSIHSQFMKHPVTDFSITGKQYGIFLCEVLDEWKKQDLGRKHVQIFDATLANLNDQPAGICVHEPLCGHSGVVEMNGDVYSCDRFAFDAYKLGNILETQLGALMEKNRKFGMHKTLDLPDECLDCDFIKLCFGGCPKDRFLLSLNGQKGKNFLCDGYQMFFDHFTQSMADFSR